MTTRGNPWDDPNWKPLKREATLIRQLLGSGVTSIGKASYADGLGNYYNAFFGLSIGLERLAKLICVCDHAISHKGKFPSPKILKTQYGHDIPKLFDAIEAITEKHKLKLSHGRPAGIIERGIVSRLSSFANAAEGRYNNFDILDNSKTRIQFEPLQKWWDEVAEPILSKHYIGKPIQIRKEAKARTIVAMMGGNASVLYFNERGDLMNTLYAASLHTGQTEIVQKFSRFYTLTVIRWLADVFYEISNKACYEKELDSFFGHYEFFSCYRVDDSFLKTRKVWPLP